MVGSHPDFTVALARSDDDIRAAQRLRYRVFVEELGGGGPMVDHDQRLEMDCFDPSSRHLLLRDRTRPEADQVVGVYRLMTRADAEAGPGFYTASEYDLSPLLGSGRPLLELGRSCLHPAYRGGAGMYHLWRALSDVIDDEGIDLLFGVASFHGTDIDAIAGPLSLLHHLHLAPPDLRPRSSAHVPMDILPLDAIDKPAALRATPALIKAYLRLGGMIGDGAFVDHAFNTTDICLIVDTSRLNARLKAIYSSGIRV
ncbi:GNAT family N-acetyltransferase [Ponticoccus sp. SC2-23]|uniref:GNAT family N-acetyltransferase n=1 Tax=Alexandriicola marinus TaxID=2081710 RepID=UPI000FD6E245|nr:GNAT family N-acyltransferase [Alexandriicola marinus]MBM1218780.1 GNAT family N-acetyltransferase [Ponticoccus sp. SC6-9]MBM1224148.1 GNAT family N-acetyltransferase [Ponticoccus sp. SC6-15]MBM1230073.1 GNAT family N-acetyltransferase [Ponticoccus sp. SC6-38]MBM1233114.1 GNAT family N-acetyltransferase [Ponticoccus sp. SC6-45]MBM1236936.1 GNAT family N-acetyltransferase [Ponticoccus sp. SC6-49]MBM1242125.1 GNAT family N-acetyltransferase [Ponticoccus sp. SC2-64]MBM1246638.1 GNAT family N